MAMTRPALLLLTTALAACTTVPRDDRPDMGSRASATAPDGAAGRGTAIAPLDYRTRTLANGLRVYSIRDTSSPNVSVQVWYDVGSKDDPRGRSGFAHLFEHLMFKSTRNLVPEQLDRLTEDVGGFNNASTADDYTNYYEVVPANHLQRLLWAEAERMGSLVVEPGFFASERDVVKEEYRSRVLSQPYGKMFYLYYPQISYDRHPYARPGIGSIEDLDAATIDDVRAFHATYYRPDNAVLVVAGNFDEAQLDRWIDGYFAPIARPAGPIPRVRVEEPVRTEARRFTVYEPNTPLPAAMITYPVPPASDKDSAVIELIGAILSAGRSSRLYQSLVYRDQLASQADSFAQIQQGRGTLIAYAIMAGGKTAEAGEAALRAEIARLRDAPVSAAELAEAKNELLTSALRERETVDGKASDLAEAVIVSGDPKAADRRLAQIAAVTPADIQRVARTWLREERSAALRYLPEEAKPAGATGDRIVTPATVQTAALATPANIRIVQPASAAERQAPPEPGPEVRTAIPAPVTQRLANGLTVISVERRDLPLLSASLVVSGGSARDPEGKSGLAQLSATLLTQGTATRSATEIAQAVEALGGSLQSSADWDGTSLGLTVKSDQADPALAIMADVARNPAFAAEELERQRSIAMDSVTVAMKDPGTVSQLVAARAVFGDGDYGHPASGTLRSLKAIGRADVMAAYRAAWAPRNATLVLTGDVDPAAARALAERHFGTWTADTAGGTDTAAAAPAPKPQVIVIDMPGAGQAAVAVARGAISRGDPRFYETLVANAVLGTGFSARLNQEIRIKRGLAYGARSELVGRRNPGAFLATTQTKNPSAPEVLGLVLAEMRRLGAQPIPAAELVTRQAVLNGSFGRRIETTSGLASLVADYVIDGVSPEEIARYQQSVSAVTPHEAQRAAADLLDPAGATMVIVGDASTFLPKLRQERGNVTVIPLSALNLDSPTLR
jgi:zinc protease